MQLIDQSVELLNCSRSHSCFLFNYHYAEIHEIIFLTFMLFELPLQIELADVKKEEIPKGWGADSRGKVRQCLNSFTDNLTGFNYVVIHRLIIIIIVINNNINYKMIYFAP